MRRGYVLLGALAFLLGALTPLTVSAEDYDELGTLDEGVYAVESDEDRFRLAAEDDTGVVVYDPAGELVLARQLDAGEEHDFVLQTPRAIVAVFGGPASIEATGTGDVTDLDLERDRIELASADGEPVDTSVTVQLPDALVGIAGTLEGDADDLTVAGEVGHERVFRADGDGLDEINQQMPPRALDASAIDVDVTADELNGTVWLELVTPVVDRHEGASATAHADDGEDGDDGIGEHPAIGALAHTPVRVTVEDEAQLVFDVHSGHLLDASVYDEEGDTVMHVHRGPDVAKARSHCRDLVECSPVHHERMDELAPQTIERTLDAGTYVLYVREGAVRGNATLTDAQDRSLFEDAQRLELAGFSVRESTSLSLDRPLLDVFGHTWGTGADEDLSVSVDGAPVYTYSSTLSTPAGQVDSEHTMAPGELADGEVTVEIDGVHGPQDRLAVELFTVPG